MQTKTDKAVTLFRKGELKEALKIFCTFRIGFTKAEKRTLDIAKDTLCGRGKFYRQLGIDTDGEVATATAIIIKKYCLTKN